MIIGIPKEIMHEEARVAATPDTVKKYVADGHKVLVECGAGVGALHSDEAYAAAGAQMWLRHFRSRIPHSAHSPSSSVRKMFGSRQE